MTREQYHNLADELVKLPKVTEDAMRNRVNTLYLYYITANEVTKIYAKLGEAVKESIYNRYKAAGTEKANMLKVWSKNKGRHISDTLIRNYINAKLNKNKKKYSTIKYAGRKSDNGAYSEEVYEIETVEDIALFESLVDEAIEYLLKEKDIKVNPNVLRQKEKDSFKLYSYQRDIICRICQLFGPENINMDEVLLYVSTRAGKSIISLEALRLLGFNKILVISPQPSAFNSFKWYTEYHSNMKDYHFLHCDSNFKSEDLNGKDKVVVTLSFQGTKVEKVENGEEVTFDITDLKDYCVCLKDYFDAVIVDEAHHTSESFRSQQIFKHLNPKKILYMSGTPFKDIASGRFTKENTIEYDFLQFIADCEEHKNDPSWPKLPKMHIHINNYEVVDKFIKGNPNSESYDGTLKVLEGTSSIASIGVYLKWLYGYLKPSEFGTPFPVNTFCNESDGVSLRPGNHALWLCKDNKEVKKWVKAAKNCDFLKEYHIHSLSEEKCGASALEDKINRMFDVHEKCILVTCRKCTTGVTLPKLDAVYFFREADSEEFVQTIFRTMTPHSSKKDVDIYCMGEKTVLNVMADYYVASNDKNFNEGTRGVVARFLRFFDFDILTKNGIFPEFKNFDKVDSVLGDVRNLVNFYSKDINKLLKLDYSSIENLSEKFISWSNSEETKSSDRVLPIVNSGEEPKLSAENELELKKKAPKLKKDKTEEDIERKAKAEAIQRREKALRSFRDNLFRNIDHIIYNNKEIVSVCDKDSNGSTYDRSSLCCYDYFAEVYYKSKGLEDLEEECYKVYTDILNYNKKSIQFLINRLRELINQRDNPNNTQEVIEEACITIMNILSSLKDSSIGIPFNLFSRMMSLFE